MYKVEEIERDQYDCHLLRIAWYEARSKKWRDLATAAPDTAVDKFIELWKNSETHKNHRYTVEEVSKLNLGNLVKHIAIPHLVTILDSRVMEDVIKRSGGKYYLE